MKTTIKELGYYQKIFIEAIKLPQKFKTAENIEKFLKQIDEIVKKAMEDFGMKEKKDALVKELNEEIQKRFADVDMNSEENKNKTAEQLKQEIAKEVQNTEASRKDKELNEEFAKFEVEVTPIEYVLDESLPGMFNITMRDDKSWIVIFRQRESKK